MVKSSFVLLGLFLITQCTAKDTDPSLLANKMMQHMADNFNENADRPADVNADDVTDHTFRPSHLETSNSLSNGLMELRDGLYSMLETTKNIPLDKIIKDSEMVTKQTAVYYEGEDGITTKKIIRKCCIGNDCYTPEENEECDKTKIPRSGDDEQQRRSKGVRESKNSISNSAPELDSQKSSRLPSATGNLNKARRRVMFQIPTFPSISDDRNVESSSTLEPNDSMLNKSSSLNDRSYQEDNDLRNDRTNSKNFESISKSESLNDIENIKRTILQRTNEYRQKHNLSDLKLNDKLNEESQTWADNLLSTFNFMDIPHRVYGINLYSTIGGNNIGKEAVDTWYNEMALFNPEDTEEDLEANIYIHHMTQLLWKNSQQVGIGVSEKNGKYVIVCHYNPPGNIASQYYQNLPDITSNDIDAAQLALEKKTN